MTDGDVLVKILESHTKHQDIVEARLIAMTQIMSDSNERLIRLEAAGIEGRLTRMSDRITSLENDKIARDGGSRLLSKFPGWMGWFAALAIGFYEYLRVTVK